MPSGSHPKNGRSARKVKLTGRLCRRTLASANTTEAVFRAEKSSRANIPTAIKIGKAVAERAKDKNITKVVFDRGGYIYHGKVKALADAAREGGLEF